MRVFTLLVLFVISVTASSYSKRDTESTWQGTLIATVNGQAFRIRNDQPYAGILLTKGGSMDGRIPPRTVINSTFYGPSYSLSDNRTFDENIAIEIQYDCDKKCTGNLFVFALQFDSTNYYMVREQSNLKVIQFVCESDKRHFRLSADFDCVMRSWGYPADNKPDIQLQGSLINLRITIPGWFASRI